MLKIRDSELASILGDEQLRSLGFVLNVRGRWLRKHAPSPRRSGGGDPLSPRPAGVTKRRPPRGHMPTGPSVRSRGSSASASRAGSPASRYRRRSPIRRDGPGRSGAGRGCPSSPSRQYQGAAQPRTSRDGLGAVAYFPPWTRPFNEGERPCPTAQSVEAAARRSLHKQYVPPIPAEARPHGMGGWHQSGQTPTPSLSPVADPRFLPRGEDPSPAPPAAPNLYPWTRLSALSGGTASAAAAAGDSCEGHGPTGGSHERSGPSSEQGSWSDGTHTPNLRGGHIMSPASASYTSTSYASSVVSRLSYDDQLTLHEALPRVFPRPEALPSAAPSPPRIPPAEPLTHLPTELRIEIVNELGPADMLALRRAYPVAFGFIYSEDARYQRLHVVEKLVARKAERNLWWAEGTGAASPASLAADRRRLEQLQRDIRPRRKPLLQYAVENGYPLDDIDALVHAYQEESSIDLIYHLGLESIGQGRRGSPGQKTPIASSKARSC